MKDKRRKNSWGVISGIIALWISFIGIVVYAFMGKNALSSTVTLGMFAIMSIFVLYSTVKFGCLAVIQKQLMRAAKIIQKDVDLGKTDLEEQYTKDEEPLFRRGRLKFLYQKYYQEALELADESAGTYKSGLADYINKEFVDRHARKAILSIIPGIMTGLGILGTFIGLSKGLSEFNTESAELIESSISTLMSGIKVAFYTSIYGMVLSLVFNIVYKGIFESVYMSVDDFIDIYEQYVSGDSDKKNESTIQAMLNQLPKKIGEELNTIMRPSFDLMNETLTKFANNVGKAQVEGVNTLVNSFISEMNKSMGDTFVHLGEVLQDTCELQEHSNEFMKTTLDRIGNMAENIKEINDLSEKTIKEFSDYVEKLDSLQGALNDSFDKVENRMAVQQEAEEAMRGYVEQLVEYEEQITKTADHFAEDMDNQIQILGELEKDITEGTKQNLEILAATAEEYNKSLATSAKKQIEEVHNISSNISVDFGKATQDLAKVTQQLNGQLANSLNTTFDIFDKNLSEISMHLSGTISQVDATTERVPKVVGAAYDGLEKTFKEMQEALQKMIISIENMEKIADKYEKNHK